ncbi:hypothetical protein AA313_de0203466 [Arthrobotrys entomopaga]|nr:hypothetical protein AA313_de0203466 [Arthrobotrys entomopaga]
MGSDPQPRKSFQAPRQSIPGFTPDFNPKAVQEAAQKPKARKSAPTGPFIDAVPAGKYHVAAGMSMETHLKRQAHIQFAKRTVKMVKAARWTVLLARIMQLVAAIGLIVLLITLRGMDDLNGWIMRVPPGVAILHILYSIYHHARDPKERPPASSASYALFATAVDCCIIPFYVFIGLWTWEQHQDMMRDPLSSTNWISIFNTGDTDLAHLMVFVAFCLACAGGGLMVLTAMLTLWLSVTFRRISRMPPDMNPLDDTTYLSLTTRPSSKRFSKSSNVSDESLDREKHRSVPFLEVRTNNGSLNWEYTNSKTALDLPDISGSTTDAPLLPPSHKFDNPSRRNSQETSRSAPNSPGNRRSQGYYSDGKEQLRGEVLSAVPKPPRQTYKQRPNEWWSAGNLPTSLPGFNGNPQNQRYSTISQNDDDPRASRNTFGRAPQYTTDTPRTPPHVSSYAGSISNASAPSMTSSVPIPIPGNPNNRHSVNGPPAQMSTPPQGMTLGTLGTFATDLAPRPLSFPTNRSAPGSPQKNSFQSPQQVYQKHQHRNSTQSVGRIPYSRSNTMSSSDPALSPPKPTQNGALHVSTLLNNYPRPPPQTSLTPPQMSPTKTVTGTRMADNFGNVVYNQQPSPNNRHSVGQPTGIITPVNSAPSSPTKQQAPHQRQESPAGSVRDKKKKYENLSQSSPGRSTSWEKKQQQQAQLQGGERPKTPKIKKMSAGRRKSLKELHDEREREREKEGTTRVVSNSGADFSHMFGPTQGVRGRVISGSQVV